MEQGPVSHFSQVITYISVLTKYELISNVNIIMSINYFKKKLISLVNLPLDNDNNFILDSLVS